MLNSWPLPGVQPTHAIARQLEVVKFPLEVRSKHSKELNERAGGCTSWRVPELFHTSWPCALNELRGAASFP